MDISRRQILGLAGALGGVAALSACAGFSRPAGQASGSNELTFTTWGTEAELGGFERAIAAFEEATPGATVRLNVVPYQQMFENIDAQLQSGTEPDIFRAVYTNLGTYAGRDQLLDLSQYLDSDFGDQFTDPLWEAVQYDGIPYAVPHITDTSTILFNKEAFAAAGITSVPDTLESAWTWEEFDAVLVQLRSQLPEDRYPLAYNWQSASVTRWFSWLFQAGGRFLEEDLVTPAVDSDAGRAAVDFTKSFFERNLVPQNNSVKSATFASETFFSETAAMAFGGTFLLPDAASLAPFEVGATFQPRNARGGSDLGGNPLVATANTSKPELAAEFLAFLTGRETQLDFCTASSLLPTRKDLVGEDLEFEALPELGRFFVGQASTVQPEDAAQFASPSVDAIRTVLSDQLEQAFIGGQGTDDTIRNLSDGIAAATAR
ncbi:ABC transporter substrate-binding protein [Marisediminicola senii]|uniref:ABC transporter substrate-binding protein n=1 Tax=Marisediminicola senii TaxID=2711233 RepID=UPI0013EC89D1|nr:sugar ABC transporter substrate-binding protein [Marisediminicola senii]